MVYHKKHTQKTETAPMTLAQRNGDAKYVENAHGDTTGEITSHLSSNCIEFTNYIRAIWKEGPKYQHNDETRRG